MNNSKNLGASKPCPHCKKTIIKSVNFTGEGSFETKCVHCGTLVKINLAHKNTISLAIIITAIVVVGGIVMFSTLLNNPKHYAGQNLEVLIQKQ